MKDAAETIRAHLARHGPVELRYESLEQTWEEGPLPPARRREVAGDLERAGILVEPPLEHAKDEDVLTLRLAGRRRLPGWLLAVPLCVMALGAIGPWAKGVFATEQGFEGGAWVVLAAGAVGTLALAAHARRGRSAAPAALGALAGAVAAAVVASDFRELYDDALVSPAWGLYASFAGAALLVTLAMSALARR